MAAEIVGALRRAREGFPGFLRGVKIQMRMARAILLDAGNIVAQMLDC